jgi:hypothetical protein
MKVNMRAIFLVGTATWLLAAAAVGLWLAVGTGGRQSWLGICIAGVGIGLIGWGWSRWRGW